VLVPVLTGHGRPSQLEHFPSAGRPRPCRSRPASATAGPGHILSGMWSPTGVKQRLFHFDVGRCCSSRDGRASPLSVPRWDEVRVVHFLASSSSSFPRPESLEGHWHSGCQVARSQATLTRCSEAFGRGGAPHHHDLHLPRNLSVKTDRERLSPCGPGHSHGPSRLGLGVAGGGVPTLLEPRSSVNTSYPRLVDSVNQTGLERRTELDV
jgi:hypothetical protein